MEEMNDKPNIINDINDSVTPQDYTPTNATQPPKKPVATILIAIIAVILAISTGVFAYLYFTSNQSQPTNQSSRTSQTSETSREAESEETATSTTTESEATTSETTQSTTSASFANPIIANNTLTFNSSLEQGPTGEQFYLKFEVSNGDITNCTIMKKSENGGAISDGSCQITGLSGKVYKIANLGKGQMTIHEKVAFILEDGSVAYLPLENAITNNNYQIAGKLGLDKAVTDILPITTQSYGSYVIVFSDGTTIEYDDTLLQ